MFDSQMTEDPPPDVGGGSNGMLDADRLRALVERRRSLDAEIVLLVDEVRRSGSFLDDGHMSVLAFCRAVVRWSTREASMAVRVGRFLADHPDAALVARTGRLGTVQLERLARAYANPRGGHRLAEFLPRLLVDAVELSCSDFLVVMDRWTMHADPDGAHRSHREANNARHCRIDPVGAGFVLAGSFGALQGAQFQRVLRVYTQIEFDKDWAAAKEIWGDDTCVAHLARTHAQRTADALTQIAYDAITSGAHRNFSAFVVDVVVDEAVLTAVQARAAGDPWAMPEGHPRDWRCETQDGVPLDPTDVLTAAMIGHVRRMVVDSAGVTVDFGRRCRTFTGPVRDAVLLAGLHCDWDGCEIPASRCQTDHVHEWSRDGHTSTRNGGRLCPHHNPLRNLGYTIVQDHAGYWHTLRPNGTRI